MPQVMRFVLFKISILFLLFCLPDPAHATSTGGTCKNWMTVTMAENAEAACKRFTLDGWKRYPSRKGCIVCRPDDWISSVKKELAPAGADKWGGVGALPPALKQGGKEVAWAIDCRDGTFRWIRLANDARGKYICRRKSTGKIMYGSYYADLVYNVCR